MRRSLAPALVASVLLAAAPARAGWLDDAHRQFEMGAYEAAIALAEQAMTESPDADTVADATILRARALVKQGRLTEARRVLESMRAEAFGQEPDPQVTAVLEADILLAESRWLAAANAYHAYAHEYPESSDRPQALLGEAIALERAGHRAKAERLFATIQQDYPERAEARVAAEALELGGHVTVLVGTFRDEAYATRLQELLAAHGFEAGVLPVTDTKGEVLYRVRIGHFDTYDAAQRTLDLLAAAGYPAQVFP